MSMVPEMIDWEAVRCVSIEGRSIRFLEGGVEHEIVFSSEAALREALRRWTVDSGGGTEFFRKHDFKTAGTVVAPTTSEGEHKEGGRRLR